MHGVRRDRSQQSAELKTQRKEHEARKLQVYLDVERAFFTLRKGSNLSHNALDATTRLLNVNPEMYTAWNYRRRVLQHLLSQEGDVTGETTHQGGVGAASSSPASSREAQAPRQLLLEDLNLTMQALQMHPKVYWIWNHRRWCLQELSAVDSEDQDQQGIAKWRDELSVVNRMLERDARNCEPARRCMRKAYMILTVTCFCYSPWVELSPLRPIATCRAAQHRRCFLVNTVSCFTPGAFEPPATPQRSSAADRERRGQVHTCQDRG